MTCAQGLLRLLWGGPKLECYGTGKSYNVTCDNFFPSVPLAQKLAKDKVSVVGTMRQNRR